MFSENGTYRSINVGSKSPKTLMAFHSEFVVVEKTTYLWIFQLMLSKLSQFNNLNRVYTSK